MRAAFSRRLLPLLLIPLAGCLVGGETPDPDAERTLRAAISAYDSAWQAKDVRAIEQLLSPDYLYFSSVGGLSDRAETLRFLADTSYVLTRSRRSDLRLTLAGPVARVSSRWEGEGRYRGEAVRDDQTCGQAWMRADGNWRLFTEHCVNRPPGEARSGADPAAAG